MRWVVAIVAWFTLMIGVNAWFAWVAITGADPVSPSYEAETR